MRQLVIVSIAFVAFAFFVACGARSELDVPDAFHESSIDAPHDAGSDVVDAQDAGADVRVVPLSAICVVPEAGRPPTVCTTPLKVTDIATGGGCINDYAIAEDEVGYLEYACDDASTWAAATFEGGTFQGSISDGTFVDLCIGTHYDWMDGPNCQNKKSVWSTSQRIYGDIEGGPLTFTYAEKVIKGDSCWIPCTALGELAIE